MITRPGAYRESAALSARHFRFPGLVCVLSILPAIGQPQNGDWHLDSALFRGDSSIGIVWTATAANTDPSWYLRYGASCEQAFQKCDFIEGISYRGVAYSYGGEDSWDFFRERLAQGFLAGSHQCHYASYGDPSDTVTGADCSGFLSYVWNVPRTTTRGFVSNPYFESISKEDLRAGDALVKARSACGFHAVFVAEVTDPTEAVVWEASSTVFGCRERVTDLTHSYWDCFSAIRHPDLMTVPSPNKHVRGNRRSQGAHFRSGSALHFALQNGSLTAYRPDGRRSARLAASGVYILKSRDRDAGAWRVAIP
jgi:hypothetical protein